MSYHIDIRNAQAYILITTATKEVDECAVIGSHIRHPFHSISSLYPNILQPISTALDGG